jgi:hypothetical protein
MGMFGFISWVVDQILALDKVGQRKFWQKNEMFVSWPSQSSLILLSNQEHDVWGLVLYVISIFFNRNIGKIGLILSD